MNVVVARSAGFCWGVRRAVEKARETAVRTGKTVFTDGPLIHNEQMIAELRAESIVEAGSPGDAAGAVVMIRAHGVPPERRSRLRAVAGQLEDATCPDVARIQGLIRRHARKGYDIVIFGDPGHAEVLGLLGFAEGRGHVVSDADDVASLPALQRVCLVSQSTQFPGDYAAVASAVVARFADATVLDTICASTRNRQRELLDMGAAVEAFVIVGSTHSANTQQLVRLARAIRPTFHIQTAEQIPTDALRTFQTVGLTAGASTPAFVIEEVRRALEAL